MKEEYFVYEEKCRRCNEIEGYVFGSVKLIRFNQFNESMEDRTNSPRLNHCKTCKKMTVKDIVSYNREKI